MAYDHCIRVRIEPIYLIRVSTVTRLRNWEKKKKRFEWTERQSGLSRMSGRDTRSPVLRCRCVCVCTLSRRFKIFPVPYERVCTGAPLNPLVSLLSLFLCDRIQSQWQLVRLFGMSKTFENFIRTKRFQRTYLTWKMSTNNG